MTKILVTTSHSVLEIDIDKWTARAIHRGKGLYYGVIQAPDGHFWVAARNRGLSTALTLENECGELLKLDRFYNVVATHAAPFALRDLHQIAWYDDRIWMTCTRDNCIVIYDGMNWERWYPLPEDATADYDVHHYNSFFFADDGVWLLAHNHGPSELLHFELPLRQLRLRKSLGNIAHNIWREDGALHTCSSAENAVVNELGARYAVGSFPRGYARVGHGCRVIGLNEYAERAARDSTTPHVAMFDANWTMLKTMTLSDEGMLLDICVIANADTTETIGRVEPSEF